MTENENRRPVKSRDWGWVRKGAQDLAARGITPNQISIASIVFAAFAALFLLLFPYISGGSLWVAAILAAGCMTGRALCNLFDGLVAIEGGQGGTPAGELYNDIPDRISDGLILVAAGYAVPFYEWTESAGWLAALLAVMTAYVRTLARSLGAPVDFQGPMNKTHRIVVMIVATLLTPIESVFWQPGYMLTIALIIVIIGCVITIRNRIRAAYLALQAKAAP